MKQSSARAPAITFPQKFRAPGKLALLFLTLASIPAAHCAGGAPVLCISNAGNTVALSWPTNFPGYTLQTNGVNAFPGAWADYPVTYDIVGLNYQVTDPMAATGQFYRLRGPGTTFYVDPAGNDANTGLSLAQAWQTTSYALTNAAFTNSIFTNETTLVFTGGEVFADTNAILYGDAIQYPLLICGSGSSPAIITNGFEQDPNSFCWTMAAVDPSCVTWSNLCFRGQKAWVDSQDPTNDDYVNLQIFVANNLLCPNLTITNCRFEYTTEAINLATVSIGILSNVNIGACVFNSNIAAGIKTVAYMDMVSGNESVDQTNIFGVNIIGCTFSNIVGRNYAIGTGLPIWLLNVSNALVQGCVIHDYGSQSQAGYAAAAGVCCAWSQGVVVSSNEVYNGFWNGSVDGDGIDFDINTFSCLAEYNYVHGCDGAGLLMYDSFGGNTFRFNVAISNANHGHGEFRIYPNINTPTNNLIYNNDLIGLVSGADTVFIDAALGGSNVFANNILYSSNGNVVCTVDTTHVTFQTNDYLRGDGTSQICWAGTTYGTASDWHAATGQDNEVFSVDPKFLNGAAVITNNGAQPFSGINNWVLTAATSTLLNQATGPYGFTNGGIDWQGNALGTTFNIGAVNASQ